MGTENEGMSSEQIEQAAAGIAGDLFGGEESQGNDAVVAAPEVSEPVAEPVVEEVPPPPGTWAKDTHEIWGKLAPEARAQILHREKQMFDGIAQYKEHNDFGKVMRDVTAPYKAHIQAQGLDEPKAVQYLLNAHYKLSAGSQEQRTAYFAQLAQSYGVDLGQLGQPQQQIDPAIKTVMERLGSLEGALTQKQQEGREHAVRQTTEQVNAFASAKDEKGTPLHPYFDEVSDDIVIYIGAGADLESAYEKAIYANPVTRAKEIARLQKEHEAKLRGKSQQEAEKAVKASSTNVRGRDTGRSPTEAPGTMEDTMKAALLDIRSRPH